MKPRSRPPTNRSPRARPLAFLLVLTPITLAALFGTGCRTPGSDPMETDPTARAARIEALERAIAEDHATLEDLITRPDAAETRPIYDEPEIRQIGQRLTDQERELARLVKIRDRQAAQRPENDGR